MNRKHERVGCLPYRFDDGGILWLLFMKPSATAYGGPMFQLCKGRLDHKDEPLGDTARREAEEELGLTANNISEFQFLFSEVAHHTSGRKTLIHLFAAEVIDPNNLVPFHYETGEIAWFNIAEYMVKIRKCHRPLVSMAIEKILYETNRISK